MNTKTVKQLQRATKAVKEQHACKKGDLVVLQATHRVTACFGGSGVRVDVAPYDTFHLAKVTKSNRLGRAERIQLFGNTFDQEVGTNRVWTMVGDDKQTMAKLLAKGIVAREQNEYHSTDELRAAILAAT